MNRVTSTSFRALVLSILFAVLTGCNSLNGGSFPSAPTITSFAANPTAVTAGGSASLTGVFSNGTGVITPGNIAATSGTAVTVTPSDTTIYTLTVTNSAGATAAQTVTVTVNAAAPTITSFTANPTAVTAGGTASLTGIFANGTGVITPGNIAATSGTAVSVTPSDTTTYTLTVTNSAGATAVQTATVTVNAAAPTITSFTANPTAVTAGGTASLTGIFANGTGVITPGNIAATSGTAVSVTPTDTTTYTLTVTNSAGVTAAKAVIVTILTAQTITFANPGTQTVGTPLTLVATASSGLIVSFASTTTSVCTVSGVTATFIAAGTCSITASQAGNMTYAAATPVPQSFTVNAAGLTTQTINFPTISAQTVGTPLTLVATASSGLTVSFASTTQSICTVSGTTATFLATGTCTIDATQAGNSTYAAATMVPQSFAVSGALSSSGAPLILYTDLLSGPTSGGENNNGTYLSIFGQNFGASGLGTTTKVFIGGVEVASYRYMGASLGRSDVQQITVQVGALSGLTQGTAYPINVQVNGVNSTSYTAQTFAPNPGHILFVSLSGNDATAAVNDINHPWGDIQASTWGSGNTNGAYGAWGAAQPGDVIVFRGGTYTMQGFNDSGNVYFCKFFYGPLGSAPTGAAGTGPIAITAYPAETVIIQPPQSTTYGVFAGVNSQYYVDGNNNPTMSQWITFSNLKIVGGTEDGPISLNVMSNHWRVVNTDLSNPLSAANAGGVSGNGEYVEVLGNNIHDIGGNSSLQDHGVYLDSGANYEIAYNLIGNITGGNGIQSYNSGGATNYIDNVNIHHNMIHDVAKHGINIADTSRQGFAVWSNVVYNTADGCVRLNTTDITGAKIWNNTFYNCNINGTPSGTPLYAAIMNDWNLTSGAISFTNNIVWPSSASGYYLGGSVGFSSGEITGNKNDWYNGTDNGDVSFDANALFTNPLFVSTSTPDFHLQSGSPALNSGDTSVSSLVTSSYDATPLPASSGYYNRGALGSSAGALQSQTIAFANPGAQTVGTPLTLVATASSGLTVSFASTTSSVCTVSGTTATFIAAGNCSITASQPGNTTYAAATPVPQSFTVNAAGLTTQTINFPTISTQTVGTPLALVATATSGLTVSFASTTQSICTVSGTTATFLTAGTCSITASQAGNSTYAAATPVPQSFTVNGSSSGPLTITTTSCPGGTQLAEYAGCTIVASGGTPPYTYSLSTDVIDYPPLPEGMSLDATTGKISSSLIGGQGTYIPELVVTDSKGAKATEDISFAINGSNAFLATIFPSNSIFHHRVDAATTGLPVDTSPAASMYSAYLPESVKPFFGDEYANFPNGIPAIEVPYNQPDVAISTTAYQSYFTSGPIPAYAPVEGTANAINAPGGEGDMHVLVYLEAGGGNKPALYEMWQGIYENGPWTDSSNALWPDVTSNNLTTQGNGTSDAAGLPVGPLLVNADEVIGTGTPSAPNGAVQHPIRFTLNHMLNYWVWPATQTAGTGYCTTTGGADIPTESEIAQSTTTATASIPYPATCNMSGAAGEIYRLKATVETPACAATSPQAAIIITGFRNYGIILADNGDSGGLIGTADARWNNDDLSCLRSLILSDFEPVNVSSLMVSNDSGATSK